MTPWNRRAEHGADPSSDGEGCILLVAMTVRTCYRDGTAIVWKWKIQDQPNCAKGPPVYQWSDCLNISVDACLDL
jgi:hypothetical protein